MPLPLVSARSRPRQTLITREEYEAPANAPPDETVTHEVQDWAATMSALAAPGARVTIPRDPALRKKQVVNAFQDAFELIGGAPRLALWADQNETEFYRLYSKLMPRQADVEHNLDAEIVIKHVLPRSTLDE